MNGRQRVLLLIAIMSAIALSVAVTSIGTLYDAALDQQRERMREALGDDFDLRDFHNVVLQDGALPLTLLEERVDAFIEAARGRA